MNKILAIALWILTTISAYWFGLEKNVDQFRHAKMVNSLDENLEEYTLSQKHDVVLLNKGKNAHLMEIPDEGVVSVTEEGMREEVIEPTNNRSFVNNLESSHPLVRLGAFVELLKKPNASRIERALQAYESLPGGPGRLQ